MHPTDYVTSDLHFGHLALARIRRFCFVDAMDDVLIENWNAKVPKGARVFVLGDFSFHKRDRTEQIARQLNGRIHLVKGNHDRKVDTWLAPHVEWIRDYYESETEDGTKVVMCHYPFMTWNRSHYGSWHLHGHSHGTLRDTGARRLDVGVDVDGRLAPYSFAEIEERMQGRGVEVVDHHGA